MDKQVNPYQARIDELTAENANLTALYNKNMELINLYSGILEQITSTEKSVVGDQPQDATEG